MGWSLPAGCLAARGRARTRTLPAAAALLLLLAAAGMAGMAAG
jgi:hypothetical protein